MEAGSRPYSAFVAVLAILVLACSANVPQPGASRELTPTAAQSPSPSPTPDPLVARTEAVIDVPGGPDWPVEAFGSMWLLTPDSNEPAIARIDPATNEIVATIRTDTRLCQALGATDDAIWACAADGVARIDPQTNEVIATVEFPVAQYFGYLPYADSALWALTGQVTLLDQLVRIDPVAEEVVATYPLGFSAAWLSDGAGALWLSDTDGGKLWRFDPQTETLTEHVVGLAAPHSIAVAGGQIWLAVNSGHDSRPGAEDVTLLRISASTGEIQAEVSAGGSVFDGMIHADEDAVWVRAVRPFLTRIDASTNEVTDVFDATRLGGSVTVAYGSVWATSYPLSRVWRMTP